MIQLANDVLTFCSQSNISKKVNQVNEHLDLTGDDKEQVLTFYKSRMIDLYTMGLDFSLNDFDLNESFDDDELDEIEKQFQAQLNYWWLEVQSEWIRYNNLLNFKSAILGEQDLVLQAKASVCSYFLNPVAEMLDEELLQQNMDYLVKLVERSQFTGDDE